MVTTRNVSVRLVFFESCRFPDADRYLRFRCPDGDEARKKWTSRPCHSGRGLARLAPPTAWRCSSGFPNDFLIARRFRRASTLRKYPPKSTVDHATSTQLLLAPAGTSSIIRGDDTTA